MTVTRVRRLKSAREDNTIPGGAQIFQRIYTRLGCQARPPHFIVEFYPYSNLVHTIRLRDDTAYVRLSDILRSAPLSVLEAAAAILLGRLYRRRAPRELIEEYRHYSVARGTHRRVMATRFKRGRRNLSGAAGAAHDLAPMFSALNRKYFSGRLHRPRLGWSKRNWRAQLGCFDPGLDQIVVNTRLDRAEVPRYVVEYVLYHEMLHLRYPVEQRGARRCVHTPAFKEAERQFERLREAKAMLRKLA